MAYIHARTLTPRPESRTELHSHIGANPGGPRAVLNGAVFADQSYGDLFEFLTGSGDVLGHARPVDV